MLIEKEINQNSKTTNRHVLEERGIVQLAEEQDETGKYKGAGNNVESEEMQYSGVIRTTNTPETVRTQF